MQQYTSLKISNVWKSMEYFVATPLFKWKCAKPAFCWEPPVPGLNYSLDTQSGVPYDHIKLTSFIQSITCSLIQSLAPSYNHLLYIPHSLTHSIICTLILSLALLILFLFCFVSTVGALYLGPPGDPSIHPIPPLIALSVLYHSIRSK